MLSTTDGIVLSFQQHSDKAHILHAYTRADGRVNYMVYGLGRKHPIGLYTPLSRIRITANYTPSGLPTVKEVNGPEHLSLHSVIQSDPYKRSIALFISEVLYHVMQHPMSDEPMYEFLDRAIQALEETAEPQNFHLFFLSEFAAKLGFAMETEPPIPHSRAERQEQLRSLCAYFAEHVETWKEPRSLDILMEVFD